jgi:polynucleotide 5'-hydroxyl-kinase GRC3/NOL9
LTCGGKVEVVAAFTEHPSWRTALEDLQGARSIMLLGASNTGKTTFLAWLAVTLQAQGRRVAIVDADVGQSSLGPPTTIGLSVVDRPFQRLEELPPAALYFVGSTTPRGHFVPMIVGTRRMVDRAQSLNVDRLIIDTCGFIGAEGGQILKRAQITLVDPDVIVCFQRGHECEGILTAYRSRQRPRILRLRPSRACRQRSMGERRAHREQALRRYFAAPRHLTLSWDSLNLVETPLWRGEAFDVARALRHTQLELPRTLWAERCNGELHLVTEVPLSPRTVIELGRVTGVRVQAWPAEWFHGTLLGLLDEKGDTLGLGVLQRVHFPCHAVEVLASGGLDGICGIHWSHLCMGPNGVLQRVSSETT